MIESCEKVGRFGISPTRSHHHCCCEEGSLTRIRSCFVVWVRGSGLFCCLV